MLDYFLIFIADLTAKYNETDSNLPLSAIKSLYRALSERARGSRVNFAGSRLDR